MDTTALKMVDQLGLLEDQIDALQEQAEDLKSKIKLLGAGTYRGSMYVTTVKLTPRKRPLPGPRLPRSSKLPPTWSPSTQPPATTCWRLRPNHSKIKGGHHGQTHLRNAWL